MEDFLTAFPIGFSSTFGACLTLLFVGGGADFSLVGGKFFNAICFCFVERLTELPDDWESDGVVGVVVAVVDMLVIVVAGIDVDADADSDDAGVDDVDADVDAAGGAVDADGGAVDADGGAVDAVDADGGDGNAGGDNEFVVDRSD